LRRRGISAASARHTPLAMISQMTLITLIIDPFFFFFFAYTYS
jgi:hypothetical protein